MNTILHVITIYMLISVAGAIVLTVFMAVNKR